LEGEFWSNPYNFGQSESGVAASGVRLVRLLPTLATPGLQSASMNAAVAKDTIDRAGRALIDAASAPAKVILFGSRARGDANDRSDFDFLVVERDVADRFAETARLGRVLGRLLIPADVVVVSEQYAEKWAPIRGTLVHEAMSQGQVIAES
jgi:uncharacterized protein